MRDAIIEEIRTVRDEYARRFNYDVHAMCAELRREQELSGAQVVSFAKGPLDRPAREGAQADTGKPGESMLVR